MLHLKRRSAAHVSDSEAGLVGNFKHFLKPFKSLLARFGNGWVIIPQFEVETSLL